MTREFVTLPREVVEQALESLLNEGNFRKLRKPLIEESIKQIKAALEQPQGEQDPVTLPRFNTWSPNEGDSWYDCPADAQIIEDVFGCDMPVVGDEYEVIGGWCGVKARYRITSVSEDGDCEVECVSHQHAAAAPQPPAPEQSQNEQEPVGEVGSMPGTTGFTMACFHASDAPVGTKLYTRPQPKREPLTRERVKSIQHELSDTVGCSYETMARAIEAAHNIK